MFDIDRWREIWASIKANKLRTFLSGLTIALALFVFITLFGLSKGLQNGFEQEFFPPNVKAVFISTGRTSMPFRGNQSDRRIQLKMSDYKLIQEDFGDKASMILPNSTHSITARNFSEYGSYQMTGTIPEQKKFSEHKIIKGRFLDDIDGVDLEKNVVIGRLVEKDLFKTGTAVGQSIQLGSTLYKVVGVFSDEDGDDAERLIYLPLETMNVIYGTDEIDEIIMIPNDDLSLDGISEMATAVLTKLKSVHSVHPDDTSAIRVYDPKGGLEATNEFFLIFTIIVFIIGIGSLIAGIVSIGNMMVFSVKERTKEIGIRKALGAQPSNIIGLILQEAILITFLFGFIGILLATLLTNSIEDSLKDYLIYDPTVETSRIVLATLVLFISGMLAGFIPARRASKIKPIEALNEGE